MVVSQGDKLLVGLHVTEYWMLIGRGRGVGYNRETSWITSTRGLLLRGYTGRYPIAVILPIAVGIPITPRRLFSRTKTPRRKVRDPTSTLPKCPRCEKSKIRKVVDTKFPRYDHYTIRKVRDAKTPRYNKSHTRELPDCIEIEKA